MIDREKVMTWLTICGKNMDCSGCCPYLAEKKYKDPVECMSALMRDALELLKEQPRWISVKDRLPKMHMTYQYDGDPPEEVPSGIRKSKIVQVAVFAKKVENLSILSKEDF